MKSKTACHIILRALGCHSMEVLMKACSIAEASVRCDAHGGRAAALARPLRQRVRTHWSRVDSGWSTVGLR